MLMLAWFVAYTDAQRERVARDRLQGADYQVYLPMERHARGRLIIEAPLFRRYLFVGVGDGQSLHAITKTVGVRDLLRVNGVYRAIDARIVDELRRAEGVGLFDATPVALRLKPGTSVRAISGPFKDLVGKIMRTERRKRVSVIYEMFSRTTVVTMPVASIELL